MKKIIMLLLCLSALTAYSQTKITIGSQKMTYTKSTVTSYVTTVTLSDKTVLSFPVKTPTVAQITAAYNLAHPVTPPPVTPPSGLVYYVGDGKSQLVIDGLKVKYPAGSTIIVKPGTYPNDITIQNLTNVNVVGTGVILDGLNKTKAGQFNALHLSGLNTVKVTGFTVQNVAFHPVYIDYQLKHVTLQSLTLLNCTEGIVVDYNIQWDGTDNTVSLLDFTIAASIFDNVGVTNLGGDNFGIPVTNLVKGLHVYGNTFRNIDGSNVLDTRAVDGFDVHDNVVLNINLTDQSDERLFMFVGNGDAYNNTFTNTRGHSIAINPISFSPTVRTVSHFYNNTTVHTLAYSQYEVQQFNEQFIKGVTQAGDVVIDKSYAQDMNTSRYPFDAGIIDDYVGNDASIKDRAKITVTNSTLINGWFAQPKPGVFWNMNAPDVYSGNTVK